MTSIAAADEATASTSYMDLAGKGFEIRDVTVVSGAAADTLSGTKDANPQALVTLQRGDQTAVCFFNAINWMNMVPSSLTGKDRCAVY